MKNILFLKISLIFLIVLFFSKCKKDTIPIVVSMQDCDVCNNFKTVADSVIVGFIINSENNREYEPYFNPNNVNEFVYVSVNNNNFYSLAKHNLKTGKDSIILNNIAVIEPKWGKNGLITFHSFAWDIFTITENGNAITQLTNTQNNLFSGFTTDNNVFYYHREYSLTNGLKIRNLQGVLIDSLNFEDPLHSGISRTIDVNNKNEAVASFGESTTGDIIIKVFNLTTKKITEIFREKNIMNSNSEILGIAWHPNNEDIFFSRFRKGLFKININSGVITKIRNGCDSRTFNSLSISADGKRILVGRTDVDDFDKNTGIYTLRDHIYIMDIDGKNEQLLKL